MSCVGVCNVGRGWGGSFVSLVGPWWLAATYSNTDPNKSLSIGRPAMLRHDPESDPDCNMDYDRSPYAWTAPLQQTYTDNGCVQNCGGLARTSVIVGSLFLVNIDIDHFKQSLISLRS
jgi:hypothetical protein